MTLSELVESWTCRTCGWKGREAVKSETVIPKVGPVTEYTCPRGHWVGSERVGK